MNDDVLAQALADSAEEDAAPKIGAGFDLLNTAIEKQLKLEDRKEQLEALLKQCNKDLEEAKRKTAEVMADAKVPKFETDEGAKVSIETTYFTSVIKANLPSFYDWLEDNERGGIIDAEVVLPLGKGRWAAAKELADALKAELDDVNVTASADIHWATLRAVGRELFEEGVEVPDFVTINPVPMARIKRAKSK